MSGRGREVLLHLACAALPGAACTLYLSSLIYLDNSDHFANSFLGLAVWLAIPAAVVGLVLGLATAWLPARARAWAQAAFLATFLWVPISASIFQERFALDGEDTIVEADVTQRWIALAVCAVVWLVLLAAVRKVPAAVGRFATFVAVGMAGMVVWTAAITWDGRALLGAELSPSYSPEKNVVVLVLDKLQGRVFADVLAADPGLAEELEGFTWFPRTKGVARSTYLSLPTMHSGEPYVDGEVLGEWFERSIEEKSFVNRFADAGWDTTVVYPVPQLSACPDRARACIDGATLGTGLGERRRNETRVLLGYALLKVAPGPAKAWFMPDEEEDEGDDPSKLTGIPAAVLEGNVVLDALAAGVAADADRPTLRFVHVLSTHSPIVADAACGYRKAGWRRETAADQTRCAFRKVGAWLDAMKAAGVYDNTTIVMLSDHGGGFPAEGENQAVGFANAFLAVKPAGATGALATSSHATSLLDVAATVCALTGVCSASRGRDVTDPAYVAEETPFISFEFRGTRPDAMGAPDDEVFRIGDAPEDFRSWTRVSGSQPCDGTASFDWKVRGLSTYGLGWSAFSKHGQRTIRKAMGPRAELFLCMGDGLPDKLEILAAASAKAWAGARVDVLLDGARIGDFVLAEKKLARATLPLPPEARQPSWVHLVTLRPHARAGVKLAERTPWGLVGDVALR